MEGYLYVKDVRIKIRKNMKMKKINLIGLFLILNLSLVIADNCTTNWQCSDWNDCSTDGTRIRTCTDISKCNITTDKPAEREDCIYNQTSEEETNPIIEQIEKSKTEWLDKLPYVILVIFLIIIILLLSSKNETITIKRK